MANPLPIDGSYQAESTAEPASSKARDGLVKWFDVKKGFGFIEGPDGKDVFVHFSAIESDGFRTLKDGETVSYELHDGDKGLHALNVRRQVAEAGPAEVETEMSLKAGQPTAMDTHVDEAAE